MLIMQKIKLHPDLFSKNLFTFVQIWLNFSRHLFSNILIVCIFHLLQMRLLLSNTLRFSKKKAQQKFTFKTLIFWTSFILKRMRVQYFRKFLVQHSLSTLSYIENCENKKKKIFFGLFLNNKDKKINLVKKFHDNVKKKIGLEIKLHVSEKYCFLIFFETKNILSSRKYIFYYSGKQLAIQLYFIFSKNQPFISNFQRLDILRTKLTKMRKKALMYTNYLKVNLII